MGTKSIPSPSRASGGSCSPIYLCGFWVPRHRSWARAGPRGQRGRGFCRVLPVSGPWFSNSRAGSWPGTRRPSAGCGLARYHPSARSEEVTAARLLAGFPREMATVWAEIPSLGTVGWESGGDGEWACCGGLRRWAGGGEEGDEGVWRGMRV